MVYKAGIVGCGRIGSEFEDCHANAYKTVKNTDLVAVADVDVAKRDECTKRWKVPACYLDYIEMLEEEQLDILSICTWSDTHFEIAKKAVECNVKAIYCEKPIADTLDNARNMVSLCEENNVVLQTNHQRRFSPLYQSVRNYILQNKLGKIEQIIFSYTRGITNTGSHMFDLLRFLFGDFSHIVGAYESRFKSYNKDDPNVNGVIKFNDIDAPCLIYACNEDVDPYIFELDIIGTDGYMQVDDSHVKIAISTDSECEFDIQPKTKLLVVGVEHLINCLEDHKESISSGYNGLKALEIIETFKEKT